MDPEVEVLTVTLTQRDKRALKVLAATEGRTMRDIVRRLIRDRIDPAPQEAANVTV